MFQVTYLLKGKYIELKVDDITLKGKCIRLISCRPVVERKEENGKRFTVIVLGEETGNDKYELGIFLG